MKGRQLKFILLLCTFAVLAYLAGEILLLFVFDNNNIWVSRGWLIAVFLATLAISVWKCPRDPDQHKGE